MAKRILVADDNPTVRKSLCQLFEAEKDYDICAEAENGQEAIDLASETQSEADASPKCSAAGPRVRYHV